MALYGRLTSNGETGSPAKMSIHAWCAAVGKYFRAKITLAQITNAFTLQADDLTELAAIKAQYDAKAATAKVDYLIEVQETFVLCVGFPSTYTEAKAKSDLGF